MNESQGTSTLFIRLVLIASSSASVAIPQILWSLYGYRGILLIVAESLFIILGFLSLLVALLNPIPGRIEEVGRRLWSLTENKSNWGRAAVRLAPFGILVYSAYLAVPNFISNSLHYNKIPSNLEVVLFFVTIVLLAIIVASYWLEKREGRKIQFPYYVSLSALALTWAIAFWYGSPRYPTDEMLLDYYSAHLLLGGTNPYIASSTAGVFSFFHSGSPGFPLNIGTPFLTGGLVTSISYPALSVLIYVPAQFLSISPSATLLPLYIFPALFIFYAYSKEKSRLLSLLPVFILLLDPSYLIQTGLGYPDLLWVIFLLISLFFYKRPVISGISMGLALAVKQIPWLIFPFFLIMIYRESGKKAAIQFTVLSVIAFTVPNLFFIISNPVSYLHVLTAPEFTQLMGVGFGPSQLGFLGILPLSRSLFTVIMVCLTVAFLVVYIAFYENLKFAFLAFPLVVFLFNYRFLLDYVVFWPLIALIVPFMLKGVEKPSTSGDRITLKFHVGKKTIALALAVLLVGIPLSFQETHTTPEGIIISDVSVTSLNSTNITGISLHLELNYANVSYGQVLYRIIPMSSMPNLNGYLWQYDNLSVYNQTAIVTIMPSNSVQQIPYDGSYRITAYYGSMSSTVSFNVYHGTVSKLA